jgi:hypothetical protein
MKKMWILLALALVLVAGCAPGPNDFTRMPTDDPAGFWKGLWHGFIVLITFVISLFNDNVSIYEIHNKGNLYNLGFVLGAMAFFSGSGRGACKRKKN